MRNYSTKLDRLDSNKLFQNIAALVADLAQASVLQEFKWRKKVFDPDRTVNLEIDNKLADAQFSLLDDNLPTETFHFGHFEKIGILNWREF